MSIKLGIIGLGLRMGNVLAAFRKAAPDLTVCGLIDRNPEKAKEKLSEKERKSVYVAGSVAELISRCKVDALAIGTRCDSHAEFAIQAARYDLPLYLEKPIATSMSQARRLEKAFVKSRCRVLVSFPLRASIHCQRVKLALDQGAVGRVEHILGTNYVNYGDVYFSTQYKEYEVTQGLFLQKATHDFDYLAWLAGAPITRIAAMASQGRVFRDSSQRGRKPDPFAYYLDGIGTPETGMNEDSSSALLEFENGTKGVYTQVFFSKRDSAQRGAIISGFAGTLSFDWYQNSMTCIRHQEPFIERIAVGGVEKENHFTGDEVLAQNFMAMIREKRPSLAPIRVGLESIYACLAAKESAETGKFVNVRRFGGEVK